jgi:hypothetical protein
MQRIQLELDFTEKGIRLAVSFLRKKVPALLPPRKCVEVTADPLPDTLRRSA